MASRDGLLVSFVQLRCVLASKFATLFESCNRAPAKKSARSESRCSRLPKIIGFRFAVGIAVCYGMCPPPKSPRFSILPTQWHRRPMRPVHPWPETISCPPANPPPPMA
jgi:hypothetical protein